MSPVDSTAVPRPPSAKTLQNGATDKGHEYCIVFVGFNLQEQALKDWLKSCCKPVCATVSWDSVYSIYKYLMGRREYNVEFFLI